ncbi:MAG TPA: extensin family protein, partial [Povalibacter sp.]
MTQRSLLIAAALAAIAAALIVQKIQFPEQLNPWAQLRIAAQPNFLTRYKLARASQDAELCQSVLAGTRWSFTPIDDEVTRPGCGYSNAVRIQHMDAAVSEPFAVSCREALSLALWERHVLQPAARKHFGAPVTRIDHFGSYSCRSVYG